MNILAIECSLLPSSLCLIAHEGATQYQHQWSTQRNHDAELFPALQHCMQLLGDTALDLIIVGAGPGSYGGVRVALAAADGIAIVRGSQVVALDSWAQLSESETRFILSDARRGGWTLRHPQGSIEVVTLEQIKQLQSEGAQLASVEDEDILLKSDLHIAEHSLRPTAAGLIESWHALSTEQQGTLLATPPAPIYVRQPHITKAKRKPWECG